MTTSPSHVDKGSYVKEMKLVGSTSNAVGEQQDIALQPSDINGRVLKAHTRT